MDNVEAIEDIKEAILNRMNYIMDKMNNGLTDYEMEVAASRTIKNYANAYVMLSELGGGEL